MIGRMVTVDSVEHLHAHAEKASGLPHFDAHLHQPRCRRVAQRVRYRFAGKLRQARGGVERGKVANRHY